MNNNVNVANWMHVYVKGLTRDVVWPTEGYNLNYNNKILLQFLNGQTEFVEWQ